MKVTVIAVRTDDIEILRVEETSVVHFRTKQEIPPVPLFKLDVDLLPPINVDRALDEGLAMIRARIVNDLYVSPENAMNTRRGQILKKLLLAAENKSDEHLEYFVGMMQVAQATRIEEAGS